MGCIGIGMNEEEEVGWEWDWVKEGIYGL